MIPKAGLDWRREIDWVMVWVAAVICLAGAAQVYSATLNTQLQGAFAKHLAAMALGIALFWIASIVDYRHSLAAAPSMWWAGILGLVAVLLFAEPINGS